MSTDRDVTRIVRSWLEEGATVLPDRVLDNVIDRLPATPQRRARWPARRFREMNTPVRIAVAAAAVVAIAVLGINLLPRQGGIGGPGASPTPTPTPTSSPVSFDSHARGVLEPGRYALDSIGPFRITFTVPAGWAKYVVPAAVWTDDFEARLHFRVVENIYADPCRWQIGHRDPAVGPTVADLATAVSSLPGLEATSPIDVTLAGYSGKRVDLTGPTSSETCDQREMRLWEDVPADVGRHRLWILDVDGDRLVIHAVDRSGATASQQEALDAIIDSITIEPSSP